MSDSGSADKPKRLYFKTYLQTIRGSIGSNMFRNFYVSTPERGEFDALDDGYNSCAFYVSAVLVIFKKISGVHGTVASTVKDLRESGWMEADEPRAGDVLVWEALEFDEGPKEHIGFSVGEGQAISIAWKEKVPVEHDQNFGGSHRNIIHIFKQADWS